MPRAGSSDAAARRRRDRPLRLDGARATGRGRAVRVHRDRVRQRSSTRFCNDDFSVLFVAQHSNSALPAFYKFTAAWGGHEGSMLFWITVLAIWTLAVAAGSRSQPEEFASRVLGVLGIVSAGIIAFALFTSNPFIRLAPTPADGNDLNPLLQDPGMIIHPPTLYVGYVGMAVPFAFAVAALLTGRLDKNWAKWTRPWTVAAWIFLTCGITLGSWWSYYELGWGGWWFWDPVENSSFMPWLLATALLHSLAVTERRGIFKSWTVLLAIAAFSLSLLGTFLTRSGVLVSVHAFAADPTRGLFILGLLAAYSGVPLLLYALRARSLEAEGGFKLVSREAFLLANNILLVIAAGTVLFGTLSPLIVDALGYGKISVGPPYFDAHVLGADAAARRAARRRHALDLANDVGREPRCSGWFGPRASRPRSASTLPLIFYGHASLLTSVASVVGLWVCAAALLDPLRKWVLREGAPLTRAQIGMCLAHFGVGVFILGATYVSAYTVETEVSARPGEHFQVGGYDFLLRGVKPVESANYSGEEGEFEVRKGGESRDGARVATARLSRAADSDDRSRDRLANRSRRVRRAQQARRRQRVGRANSSEAADSIPVARAAADGARRNLRGLGSALSTRRARKHGAESFCAATGST